MADKFLNETGIARIRDWIKEKFAQKTAIPVSTSDLTNDGDGTSPFATQDYVDGHTPETEVFKIVYQTTTSQQIGAAFDAGKIFIFDMGDGEVSWTPVTVVVNSSKTKADITVFNDEGVIATYHVNGSTWTEDYTTLAERSDIPVSTSDLTNDGDGNSPFATEAFVGQNGGKIDSISVNGTAQTIDANKNVDITIPTEVFYATTDSTTSTELWAAIQANKLIAVKTSQSEAAVPVWSGGGAGPELVDLIAYMDGTLFTITVEGSTWTPTESKSLATTDDLPVNVSELTNDSGYQTAADVQSAIASGVASAVKIKGSVATYADLPATGNQNGDMYDTLDTGRNYVWIESSGSGRWDDYAGTMDLSAYWTSTTGQTNTLEAMTIAEINAILNPSA